MTRRANIFTIPATASFLPTLAGALLDGVLVPSFAPRNDPLALAGATIFLPTRRATRAFAEALQESLGTEATLLPRIVPLGDVDEDVLAFADAMRTAALPPAITPAARRLILAHLVLRYARVSAEATGAGDTLIAATPAAALTLADELARLFDDLTIAGVPFERLDADGFVPAEMDEYWQRSLAFLRIARKAWHEHLLQRGLLDPVERRDALLAREAERLAGDVGGPFIVAGSTGTIPAVAKLIAAIARRDDSAVVLPGIDQTLDNVSFGLIQGGKLEGAAVDPSPGHPQFGLARLLKRLGIDRSAVQRLGPAAIPGRERLLSEAFRPTVTTDQWQAAKLPVEEVANALSGVCVIEAADPREEALTLALVLRETLEEPARTAALVTADRTLARRVASELSRWDIRVDDSAGLALADTEVGRFARLAASATAEQLAPIPLLALLRDPLTKLGVGPRAIDALELAVLRGPRPAAGADGLLRAIEEARQSDIHARDPRRRLRDHDWDHATKLARNLANALVPLLALADAPNVPLADLLRAHRESLAGLGLDLADERADVRALVQAFDQFEEAAVDSFAADLRAYADAFGQLLVGEPPVRPPFDPHARLRILGPLEARLLAVDRVLVGGLNEGTWPPETHVDAWLNRPMRMAIGLDLPERRIGLAAHDFAQALGAREVVLSRARKQNGVETVASRFLQRLEAITPPATWGEACERGARSLAIARASGRVGRPRPADRPQPKPPAAARPRVFSATDIETLVRDPYSIYARYVLALQPLDPIDADPGAAERGTVLHEALAEFFRAFPEQLPADALDQLLACGRRAFARIEDFPGIRAVWWPRFERVARWFVANEADRRKDIKRTLVETRGEIEFEAGGQIIKLSARADRIDLLNDDSIVIIDYKTGETPSLRQAISGLAPQLPLEAAIARAGGFVDVRADTRIKDIAVIKPSGGEPPGTITSLDPVTANHSAKKLTERHHVHDCDAFADFTRARVAQRLAAYADEGVPYHSIPRPKWRSRFGRYDHLARIKEWSAGEEEEE